MKGERESDCPEKGQHYTTGAMFAQLPMRSAQALSCSACQPKELMPWPMAAIVAHGPGPGIGVGVAPVSALLLALLPEVLRGLLLMSRLGALLLTLLPEVLRGLLLLYPSNIGLCCLLAREWGPEGSPLLVNRSGSLCVSGAHAEKTVHKGCGSAANPSH